MISKTIDIVVTSVLQTTAGKMIFGRFIEPGVAAQAVAPPAAVEREKHDRHEPARVRAGAAVPVQPQQT
jgi:hypothetical protein